VTSPSDRPETVRLDKWLWAVRVFKTRTLAAEACQAGHVKVAGQRIKPARPVHPGEVVEIQLATTKRTVKVIAPLAQRVGAALVGNYLEELTPPAGVTAPAEARIEPLFHRPKGSGRPTKRDRRLLEHLGFEPGNE
jgi:ribosome-associated heat shock protein Hsp15